MGSKKLKQRMDGSYRTSYTENGKTKYFYGSSQKEAEKKKKDYLQNLNANNLVHGVNYSFSYWADEWLEFHKCKVNSNSYEMYYWIIGTLKKHFEKINISEIMPSDIQSFLNDMHDKGLSKSTIHKHRITLSQIYKFAMFENVISINPCVPVKVPKDAVVNERRALTLDEIKIVIKNVKSPGGFYALFLMCTGLRRSEALALTWEDIDFEKHTVKVNKVVNFKNNRPEIFYRLKNGEKERTVPFIDIIFPHLKGRKSNGLIFKNIESELLLESQLKDIWNNYINKTSLEITQHYLRHTYASILYSSGIDLKTIQEFLGHKTYSVTTKYTHIFDENRDVSIKKVNSCFLTF